MEQPDSDTAVSIEEGFTYLLEKYPQFNLLHLYTYNFREGGLTFGQVEILIRHSAKREADRMHGMFHPYLSSADGAGDTAGNNPVPLTTDKDPRFKGCVPGDPKSYSHLSPELQKEFILKRVEEDRRFFMQVSSQKTFEVTR